MQKDLWDKILIGLKIKRIIKKYVFLALNWDKTI